MSKKWYDEIKSTDDVVISSRVRLARNLEDYPFPSKMSDEQSRLACLSVKEALSQNFGEDISFVEMKKCEDMGIFLEEHLISPDFCTGSGIYKMLAKDEPGNLAIMINEEDHLRIQSIYAGFDLDAAYTCAFEADTAISKNIKYAFDENLGYLTSCPTNLGTGMRASVMLHLPALTRYGYIKSLVNLMTKLGLCVRGLFGEGTEAKGDMYQLSNQITLGISEEDTIKKLKSAVNQIVEKERELRKKMLEEEKNEVYDRLLRSFGTLKYAYKIDSSEAAKLLSDVRLAQSCGVLSECKNVNFIKLLFEIMSSHIIAIFPDAEDFSKRDKYRADIIKQHLSDNAK